MTSKIAFSRAEGRAAYVALPGVHLTALLEKTSPQRYDEHWCDLKGQEVVRDIGSH